jgi:hypothetical protein
MKPVVIILSLSTVTSSLLDPNVLISSLFLLCRTIPRFTIFLYSVTYFGALMVHNECYFLRSGIVFLVALFSQALEITNFQDN